MEYSSWIHNWIPETYLISGYFILFMLFSDERNWRQRMDPLSTDAQRGITINWFCLFKRKKSGNQNPQSNIIYSLCKFLGWIYVPDFGFRRQGCEASIQKKLKTKKQEQSADDENGENGGLGETEVSRVFPMWVGSGLGLPFFEGDWYLGFRRISNTITTLPIPAMWRLYTVYWPTEKP